MDCGAALIDHDLRLAYLRPMAVLPIITLPDPLLRVESKPVECVDDDMRKLIADMFETMYEAPGIGLAGIQVAVNRRVLVMDIVRDEDTVGEPIAMINPEIVWRSDTPRVHEEGCLSIPEMFAEVERPRAVRVTYLDEQGRPEEMLCEDLLATVVQHEIDHLDGLLFIDHLSRLKRDRLVRKYTKQQKEQGAVV